MKVFLPLLFLLFLLIGAESCRKPNFTYRDPCSDSTFLALKANELSLSVNDRERLQGFVRSCEDYQNEEENRGKLWPYILSGLALIVGVATALFWLLRGPDVIY